LSDSECEWLERWEQLRLQLRLRSMENTFQVETETEINDAVSEWLHLSQDSGSDESAVVQDDRQQQKQQHALKPVPDPNRVVGGSRHQSAQSPLAPSCTSAQTSLSSASCQDLLRLAQATEEADAPILQVGESTVSDWSFLASAMDRNFWNDSKTFLSRINGSVHSVGLTDTCNHSQDLLATQSSTESPTPERSASIPVTIRSPTPVGDPYTDLDEANTEALIVAQAKKSAVAYFSGQLTQTTLDTPEEQTVLDADASRLEADDDLVMSERIPSDENYADEDNNNANNDSDNALTSPIPDAFWVSHSFEDSHSCHPSFPVVYARLFFSLEYHYTMYSIFEISF
uniref:DUF3719 domain-containing protein n=1 Tax=Echinostoma caproni TaxID=27848 RepID=A0A183A260_9TREM